MLEQFHHLFRPRLTAKTVLVDKDITELGLLLKENIAQIYGRSIAIREVDSGSDNAAEIELNNLSNPYYDIERFGISFAASPRHADILVVTGAVTRNMELALINTYEAMPSPKLVIAIGDDACDGGIFKGTYAVLGGADKVIPVDIKIHGNPPSPREIMQGLLALIASLHHNKSRQL